MIFTRIVYSLTPGKDGWALDAINCLKNTVFLTNKTEILVVFMQRGDPADDGPNQDMVNDWNARLGAFPFIFTKREKFEIGRGKSPSTAVDDLVATTDGKYNDVKSGRGVLRVFQSYKADGTSGPNAFDELQLNQDVISLRNNDNENYAQDRVDILPFVYKWLGLPDFNGRIDELAILQALKGYYFRLHGHEQSPEYQACLVPDINGIDIDVSPAKDQLLALGATSIDIYPKCRMNNYNDEKPAYIKHVYDLVQAPDGIDPYTRHPLSVCPMNRGVSSPGTPELPNYWTIVPIYGNGNYIGDCRLTDDGTNVLVINTCEKV